MRLTFVLLITAALTACSPNVETRGHLRDADWASQITANVTTRDQVAEALGSPSATSTFGEETWYYITTRRESFAFLKPEVADQEVVEITFNSDGTVKNIGTIGKDKARDFAIAKRITPTEGHQMTFMEQLLGNLGRFNSPGNTPGSAGNSRAGRI